MDNLTETIQTELRDVYEDDAFYVAYDGEDSFSSAHKYIITYGYEYKDAEKYLNFIPYIIHIKEEDDDEYVGIMYMFDYPTTTEDVTIEEMVDSINYKFLNNFYTQIKKLKQKEQLFDGIIDKLSKISNTMADIGIIDEKPIDTDVMLTILHEHLKAEVEYSGLREKYKDIMNKK